MTLQQAAWLENAGEVYHADLYRRILAALTGEATGVVDADDMAVTEKAGTPAMSVDVAAGHVVVASTRSAAEGAYHAFNDDVVTVAISAADATNDRIDRVCVRFLDSEQGEASDEVEFVVVEGTPAASPALPTITLEDFHELAQVLVQASTSSIVDADITDTRYVLRKPTLLTFTSSGSFEKADYPGMRGVRVRAVGAGGGGGSVNGGSFHGNGGGGGAGGYAETVVPVEDLLASETVTVGAGGSGGGSGGVNSGSSGGSSSFGAHAAANGGAGGTGNSRTSGTNRVSGGAGGSATAGDVQITGGGGGVGATAGGVGMMFNAGGSNPLAGAIFPTSSNAAGLSGIEFGGGGAGGTSTATNVDGGAGADGAVIVDVLF